MSFVPKLSLPDVSFLLVLVFSILLLSRIISSLFLSLSTHFDRIETPSSSLNAEKEVRWYKWSRRWKTRSDYRGKSYQGSRFRFFPSKWKTKIFLLETRTTTTSNSGSERDTQPNTYSYENEKSMEPWETRFQKGAKRCTQYYISYWSQETTRVNTRSSSSSSSSSSMYIYFLFKPSNVCHFIQHSLNLLFARSPFSLEWRH